MYFVEAVSEKNTIQVLMEAPPFEGIYTPKGPRSLKGLVKLWAICVKLVLPGLQIDSKADHNPLPN